MDALLCFLLKHINISGELELSAKAPNSYVHAEF